jgi:multiple sugar transport system permease protein
LEKRIGTIKRKENIKGFWLTSPYLLFTVIFFGYPFVWLVILAFSKWNFISSPQNIGIGNFTKLFSDPMFWTVFENTIRFMLEFIPMVLVSSIALAIAFSKARYMRSFFAMSFLIANVSSGVAYSILFEQIFASNGPVNNFLYDSFGIFIPWFSDPNWAMFSIAIMVTWKFMGYYALIFLSGLQSIPNELYEAAKLDGANRWTLFWKITLPLLNSSFVMVVVLAITLAFGIFTEPFIITGGGPLNSTQTFMMIIYTDAFEKYQAGYSATIAIVAAGLSFLMIFIVRKLMEKNVSFS